MNVLFNSLTDAESGFVGNFLFSSKYKHKEYYFTFHFQHDLVKYLYDKYIFKQRARGEVKRMQLIVYIVSISTYV